MSAGQWILVVSLVAAVCFGVFRAWTDGRFTGTHRVRGVEAEGSPPAPGVLDGHDLEAELGERATLLQFSSAFCAPCRVARRVLSEVAAETPGVAHVEIDAEHHLELVRRLGILRTPTTLVLDAGGREVGRAAGAPTKAQVLTALDELRDVS